MPRQNPQKAGFWRIIGGGAQGSVAGPHSFFRERKILFDQLPRQKPVEIMLNRE
jgi:hypothetical protein